MNMWDAFTTFIDSIDLLQTPTGGYMGTALIAIVFALAISYKINRSYAKYTLLGSLMILVLIMFSKWEGVYYNIGGVLAIAAFLGAFLLVVKGIKGVGKAVVASKQMKSDVDSSLKDIKELFSR